MPAKAESETAHREISPLSDAMGKLLHEVEQKVAGHEATEFYVYKVCTTDAHAGVYEHTTLKTTIHVSYIHNQFGTDAHILMSTRHRNSPDEYVYTHISKKPKAPRIHVSVRSLDPDRMKPQFETAQYAPPLVLSKKKMRNGTPVPLTPELVSGIREMLHQTVRDEKQTKHLTGILSDFERMADYSTTMPVKFETYTRLRLLGFGEKLIRSYISKTMLHKYMYQFNLLEDTLRLNKKSVSELHDAIHRIEDRDTKEL